jgi:hypothetical protein
VKTFLFLDDLRRPWGPEWHHVKTYDECITAIDEGGVEHLSLDHDLSELHYNGELGSEKTGYHVVLWMAEFNKWPSKTLIIHTMNPSGRDRMLQTAKRYAPEGLEISVQIPHKEMNEYTAYEEVLRLTGRLKRSME